MQTPYADRPVHSHERAIDPLRDTGVGRTSASASALDALALDRQFLSLLQSFRPSGGVSGAQGVADLLFTRSGQHVGTLARWIVRGEVVHFDWQHDTWLPMFQFDLRNHDSAPQRCWRVERACRRLRSLGDGAMVRQPVPGLARPHAGERGGGRAAVGRASGAASRPL